MGWSKGPGMAVRKQIFVFDKNRPQNGFYNVPISGNVANTMQQQLVGGDQRAIQDAMKIVDPRTGNVPVDYVAPTPGMAAAIRKVQERIWDDLGMAAQGFSGGGSGISGGGGRGGSASTSNPLFATFEKGVRQAIENPGLTEAEIQAMVNRSNEGFTGAQESNERDLAERAAAAGFGRSGALQAGQQALGEQYATQKAGAARDIRLGAAQDRGNKVLQALGVGGGYLGRLQDNANAQSNWLSNYYRNKANNHGGALGGYEFGGF